MASRDAAHRVVNRLFKWHCAMNPKRMGQHERVMGHLLQIAVPRAQAARFVYPSVSWGLPVAIRRVETDGAERLHAYSDVPREDGPGEGLEVLLDSPQRSQLQSRILAHHNLFHLHGAKAAVFHANKHFDAHTFRAQVANELAPWIRVARLRTRGLRFTKFRRSSTIFLLSQPRSFFSKTVFWALSRPKSVHSRSKRSLTWSTCLFGRFFKIQYSV
jgi:hypothetical protein